VTVSAAFACLFEASAISTPATAAAAITAPASRMSRFCRTTDRVPDELSSRSQEP
jgi:hypothetical protein